VAVGVGESGKVFSCRFLTQLLGELPPDYDVDASPAKTQATAKLICTYGLQSLAGRKIYEKETFTLCHQSL
jgi:hypothetical protein